MATTESRAAFAQLAEPVQRWIERKGWADLSEVQTKAVEPVLRARDDVLLTAATAGGKTEAAFLPILTHLLDRRREAAPGGVEVLYLSPLKALINDQDGRLEQMCEPLDIPVHPWHGDIAASRKKKVWRDRAGILLITPESVEGLLCHHGERAQGLLGGLRYIVVDELHAFPGSPRGAQLGSLLHRIDLLALRRVPRIGLSATLGKLELAAQFLRPERPEQVVVVEATADKRLRQASLRGYTASKAGGGDAEVVQRLYATLRGETNLVFANTRGDVEKTADRLRQECEQRRLPNEFFAHHGSLSKAEREDVEERLKSDRPGTAVCTSTLEMGIDIGQVREVAQIRCPPSVAALRQRWGRSGRRPGDPSILRTYVTETGLEPTTTPQDAVRSQVVQAVAMFELIRRYDWCEPPEHGGLHLSTLVQQVMSLVAQHGGVRPAEAESVLCTHGPFHVDPSSFELLLDAMHLEELLMSSSDGLLLLGPKGERALEHFSFLAAFESAETLRVVADGHEIGSIGTGWPIFPGNGFVLAGRRWRVIAVNDREKVVEVVADAAGTAPRFASGAGSARVHDRVRKVMHELYLSDDVPPYLDEGAQRLLAEGRTMFGRLELHASDLVDRGRQTVVFPWRGDRVLDTLLVALHHHAKFGVEREGPVLVVDARVADVEAALASLAASPPPDPLDLAATVAVKAEEKWDEVLSPRLLDMAYAARALDVERAWAWLRERSSVPTEAQPVPMMMVVDVPDLEVPSTVMPVGAPVVLGSTPFAVVDVETSGFAAGRGHRVVEIAIVSCRPDGSVVDFWHTLLDPEGDVGPTRVHGLTMVDVVGAPTFRDVLGDVATRLDGCVVVAHNAPFDLTFLRAEFARAGVLAPAWPVVDTMALLDRGAVEGRSLAAACRAHGIPLENAHSARQDALATAALLAAEIASLSPSAIDELGVSTLRLPPPWDGVGPSELAMPRSRPAVRMAPALPRWSSAGRTAYAEALARVVEDGEVTAAEVDDLITTARTWQLDPFEIADIHRELPVRGLATQLLTVQRTVEHLVPRRQP